VPVPANQIVAGSYCILGPREWKPSDVIAVHFPPSLRFEPLDDSRPAFDGFGTIHYGPLLLAGLTADDSLLLEDTTQAAVQKVVRKTSGSGEDLSFVATPGGDCTSAPNVTLIPFNDVRNRYGKAAYTTYFHTKAKHYASITAAGTRSLALASASDFALAGGASVSAAAAETQLKEDNQDLVSSAAAPDLTHGSAPDDEPHHDHAHADLTHRVLADPLYSRSAGLPGDYDPITGSHYKLIDDDDDDASADAAGGSTADRGELQLHSGVPHTNSSAMMAAPFASDGVLEAVSFSFRYTVGIPTQPAKNVSCAVGTQFAGGSIHVANFSSVEAAISWCKAAPKCAGFCAKTPSCDAGTAASPSSTSSDSRSGHDEIQMTEYQFKDSWGVAHHSAQVRFWRAQTTEIDMPPPSSLRLCWRAIFSLCARACSNLNSPRQGRSVHKITQTTSVLYCAAGLELLDGSTSAPFVSCRRDCSARLPPRLELPDGLGVCGKRERDVAVELAKVLAMRDLVTGSREWMRRR
jgi:hypothetical protein